MAGLKAFFLVLGGAKGGIDFRWGRNNLSVNASRKVNRFFARDIRLLIAVRCFVVGVARSDARRKPPGGPQPDRAAAYSCSLFQLSSGAAREGPCSLAEGNQLLIVYEFRFPRCVRVVMKFIRVIQ